MSPIVERNPPGSSMLNIYGDGINIAYILCTVVEYEKFSWQSTIGWKKLELNL